MMLQLSFDNKKSMLQAFSLQFYKGCRLIALRSTNYSERLERMANLISAECSSMPSATPHYTLEYILWLLASALDFARL